MSLRKTINPTSLSCIFVHLSGWHLDVKSKLKCVCTTMSLKLFFGGLFGHRLAVCLLTDAVCVGFPAWSDVSYWSTIDTESERKKLTQSVSEVCVTPVLLERCCCSACSGICQIDWNGFCLLSSVLLLPFPMQWNLNPVIKAKAVLLQSDFTGRSR